MGREGGRCADVWGNVLQAEDIAHAKAEAGPCPEIWRNSKEAPVAGVIKEERAGGNEGQNIVGPREESGGETEAKPSQLS